MSQAFDPGTLHPRDICLIFSAKVSVFSTSSKAIQRSLQICRLTDKSTGEPEHPVVWSQETIFLNV